MQRSSVNATIVIPAYNEGGRLPPFLAALAGALHARPDVCVLIVDDGSTPEHARRVDEAIAALPEPARGRIVTVRHPRNRGKGAALKTGFAAAGTPLVGFVDADGSITPAECLRVLDALAAGRAHGLAAALGTRIHDDATRKVARTPMRRVAGRIFAKLAGVILGVPFSDSQCGCKFFDAEKLVPLLSLVPSERWVADVEAAALLHWLGERTRDHAISWHEVAGSRVSFMQSPAEMLAELLRFRRARKRLVAAARETVALAPPAPAERPERTPDRTYDAA